MKQEGQLQPLIDHCAVHRGAKTDVLRRLTKAGVLANWMQISEWLHKEPGKRRVPREKKMKAILKIQKQVCGVEQSGSSSGS